jgi:type II secretory pathway component PulK
VTSNDTILTKLWNFYGDTFDLSDQVSIEIQDQNALFSLYNLDNGRLFEKLLDNMAMNVNSSMISNSLIDWQDIDSLKRINGAERGDYMASSFPTNIPLQNYHELLHIKGMNEDVWQQLTKLVTIRPVGYFNPFNAPKEILLLTLDQSRVENIIQLRENGQLTKQVFTSITSIEEDEGVVFSTGNLLKVNINVNHNDVALTKSLELYLQPYSNLPLIEYAIKN